MQAPTGFLREKNENKNYYLAMLIFIVGIF